MAAEIKVPEIAFSDLAAATRGWSREALVGKGATGEVFRGELDGIPIAVKRLQVPQGADLKSRADLGRRFAAELSVLSAYRHARLVRLLGWAKEKVADAEHPFALAFELLEGGSVADWLLGPSGEPAKRSPSLPSLARVDIALGAAAGLAYLHGFRDEAAEGAGAGAGAAAAAVATIGGGASPEAAVMHRDVKSANIGLSVVGSGEGALYAKLLDCGLAKALRGGAGDAEIAAGASFTGGLAAGTAGYMAPEVTEGTYNVRSEVYALGVVFLELLTGRRASAATAREVRDEYDDLDDLPDPADRLRPLVERAEPGVWSVSAVLSLAQLVIDCIRARPARRPASMDVVLARLRALRNVVDSAAPPLVPCPVCLEELAPEALVRCSAQNPHTLCRGCLQGHVAECAAKSAALADAEGAIPCPDRGCASRWSVADLGEVLDKGTLIAYSRALVRAAFDAPREKRQHEERMAAAEAAALAARAALAERVRALRLVIVERDLTLRCPRCATAFLDYNGCNALQCARCQAGFCALCLFDAGADAHAHVATNHGDVFDNRAFDVSTRERRRVALVQALLGLVEEGAPLQRALVAELAKADLGPLGLDAGDLLRAAHVPAADEPQAGAAQPALAIRWQCPTCETWTFGRALCTACAAASPFATQAEILSDVFALVIQHRGDARGAGWLATGLAPYSAPIGAVAGRRLVVELEEARNANEVCTRAAALVGCICGSPLLTDELIARGCADIAHASLAKHHGDAQAAEMCGLLLVLLSARSEQVRGRLSQSSAPVLMKSVSSVHRGRGSAAALLPLFVTTLAVDSILPVCRSLVEAGCPLALFYLVDVMAPDPAFDALTCEAIASLVSLRPSDTATCDAIIRSNGVLAVVTAMKRHPLDSAVASRGCRAIAGLAAGASSPAALLSTHSETAVLTALANFLAQGEVVLAALSALQVLAGRSIEGSAAIRCAGVEQGVRAALLARHAGAEGAAVKSAAETALAVLLVDWRK